MLIKVARSSILWLGAGVTVWLFRSLGGSVLLSGRLLAASSLLFGAIVFLTHGGARITAAGIWCGAFAFFVGFAGLSALSEGGTMRAFPHLTTAIGIAYFTQVCMYGLFWRSSVREEDPRSEPVVAASVTRVAVIWGLAALAIALMLVVGTELGSAASTLDESNAGFVAVRSLAFSSVAMISIALVLGPRDALMSWRWLAIGASLLLYARFIFTGGGRLTLVALAMCLAIPLSARRSYRWIKPAVVLLTIPALLLFAHIGRERVASVNPRYATTVSGLESVVNPVKNLSQLVGLSEAGSLEHTWGATFVAAAVGLAPRSLWPGKPLSLNTRIVPILQAGIASGTGQATDALAQGQWVFDFGLLGVLAMIPVFGWAIRALDRWLARSLLRPLVDMRSFLKAVIAIVAASELGTIVWGSLFSYANRTIARVAVLVALLLLYAALYRVSIPSSAPLLVDHDEARPEERRDAVTAGGGRG